MSSLIICTYAKCTARERERESKRVGKMERKGSSPWRRKIKRENIINGEKGHPKRQREGERVQGSNHTYTHCEGGGVGKAL